RSRHPFPTRRSSDLALTGGQQSLTVIAGTIRPRSRRRFPRVEARPTPPGRETSALCARSTTFYGCRHDRDAHCLGDRRGTGSLGHPRFTTVFPTLSGPTHVAPTCSNVRKRRGSTSPDTVIHGLLIRRSQTSDLDRKSTRLN